MRRLAATATLCLLASGASAHISDRLDQPAGDVVCAKWWNEPLPKMAQLRGRVVIVHFHDPTKLTSRAFEAKAALLANAHKDRPYTFAEVLVDCTEDEAAAYVSRSNATWHVGYDGNGSASLAYAGSSVPRTYLVGPDGVVAFHAHVAALTDELVDAQLTRTAWFDEKALPRKGKALAKAARELRFGAAVEELASIDADKHATDDVKALAQQVRGEITRYHEFQTKVVQALEKELDWGIVSRRVERMRGIYAGTEHADAVEAWWKRLEANPRVAWVREAEDRLDRILEKTNPRKKKDVEAAIRELQDLVASRGNSKPAERAQEWITVLEKRLAEGLAK